MFDSFVLFCWGFLLPNHGHCRRTGPKSTWSLLWVASARRRVPTRTSEVRALENGVKTEKFEEIHRYPCRNTETSHHLCHSLSFSVHFLSFSPNFLSFRKANVRRLNWLRRCISLTLLQRTTADVDLSCHVATKVSLLLEECHSVRESSCRTGKHRYRHRKL